MGVMPEGFSLIELMMTLACLGILSAIAVPSYQGYVDNTKIAQVKADIRGIEQRIERYMVSSNGRFPDSLADVGADKMLDPWGYAYQYFNIANAGPNPHGARKDKNLHPINSDYDLYSIGKDGKTVLPLTAKPSWDDVVRANDGAFLDLGSKY